MTSICFLCCLAQTGKYQTVRASAVSAVSLKGLDEMKGHDSVHFQIVSLEKAFIVLQTTVLTESDRGSWVERNKESLSHLANLCFK